MPRAKPDLPDGYLLTPEAARVVRLSERTLEKHRVYGTGPEYLKLGGRVVYTVDALAAWASRGTSKSTHDAGTRRIASTTRPPSPPNRLARLLTSSVRRQVFAARRTVTICAVGVLAIGLSALWRGPIFMLWNASSSVPIGLYWVQPKARAEVGDLAVSVLPDSTRQLADTRRYLPRNVLLIKPVAATAGATVCRDGDGIYVNGAHLADARAADSHHRLLPVWTGCHVLIDGEVFLMNPHVTDSFDGRYFGPITHDRYRGRAIPLLTFHTPTRD